LTQIVDALEPAPGDVVLEIGAGRGSLTEQLLARGLRVIAIEKDRRLAAQCGVRNAECGVEKLTVVQGDALRVDWHALVTPHSALRPGWRARWSGSRPGPTPWSRPPRRGRSARSSPHALRAAASSSATSSWPRRDARRQRCSRDSRSSSSTRRRDPRRSRPSSSCGSCAGGADCEIVHNMRKISESTVRRLYLYLRFLEQFDAQGHTTV